MQLDPRGNPIVFSAFGAPPGSLVMHGDEASFLIVDLSVNVPVPLGTFSRTRGDSWCAHPVGPVVRDGDCVAPHLDPFVEDCAIDVEALGEMAQDKEEQEGDHDGDDHHEEPPPTEYPMRACELVHPPSQPASAYKKNGKCAAYGKVTPDGIPGC